ncbi:MAG: 50S ribosomal protein L14e [Candidatus Micrarchaeia archaeon]
MVLLEEGRVCVKKLGRDSGDKAVVTKVIDKSFVMIMSHSRPKERKCNIKHLEFINEKIDVKNKEQLNTLLEINEKNQHKDKN